MASTSYGVTSHKVFTLYVLEVFMSSITCNRASLTSSVFKLFSLFKGEKSLFGSLLRMLRKLEDHIKFSNNSMWTRVLLIELLCFHSFIDFGYQFLVGLPILVSFRMCLNSLLVLPLTSMWNNGR